MKETAYSAEIRPGALLAALFSTLMVTIPCASAPAADTPTLTWTERSDWINVKTDVSPAATGNGSTNDGPAIQAALNRAMATGATQKTVYLPPGVYRIDNTLTWSACSGVALVGCGRNTTIAWYGTTGGTMFLANGATRARYIGLSWDGRNSAGLGCFHNSTNLYESRVRHEHEKFLNFTSAAIRVYGGGGGGYQACSESFIWNCSFSNCARGFWNGSDQYNSYDWMVEGCEFSDCGSAIYNALGKATILNCHFARSTVQDIYCLGNLPVWPRRCTSVDSRQFYVSATGTGSLGTVVQDCCIASWKVNPTLNFGTNGTVMLFDCDFSSPPNSTPPVLLNPPSGNTAALIHSRNAYPGSSALYSTAGSAQVYSVANGNTDTILPANAFQSFLKQSVPAEGTILDVKAPPYNAAGNNTGDDTIPIQNAINDARTAGNGAVVYIPVGTYKITSTLNVYGGNYKIQGNGFTSSRLVWAGASSGVLMSVTNPQNIRLEQLDLATPATVAAVRQTGSAGCNITYDGLYNFLTNGSYNLTGRGVELVDLPAGSRIYLQHLDSALTIDDCGRADILGKFMLQGRLIVKGADYPKIGFLGFHLYQGGQATDDPLNWDILIQDNQDAVIGLWYCENYYRHLRLERGLGTGSGRFTIQGFKQGSVTNPSFLSIDNYQGRVMYGPQWSASNLRNNIIHTGSNPLDLALLGLTFSYTQNIAPNVTLGTGANLITLSCLNRNESLYPATRTYLPTLQPSGWEQSIAASLDHLRDLGNADLRVNYGFDLRHGARASWHLDQSAWNGTPGEVLDSSGYGSHGTANGGVSTSADAHAGRAGLFDGADDKVTTSFTGTGLTGITVSAWIKRTDGAVDYRTIVGSNGSNSIKLWVNSNQLQFAIGNTAGGSGASIRDCGVVPVGVWTHVAATWSATKGFAVYVNRTLTRTGASSVSSFTWPAMTIGKDVSSTSGWVGLIDDVNVWTSALTPAEIAALP